MLNCCSFRSCSPCQSSNSYLTDIGLHLPSHLDLLNKTGSKNLGIRNTMYFAQLPFNKDQHVKLKIPDQNLKDDVIPWALIPEGVL